METLTHSEKAACLALAEGRQRLVTLELAIKELGFQMGDRHVNK